VVPLARRGPGEGTKWELISRGGAGTQGAEGVVAVSGPCARQYDFVDEWQGQTGGIADLEGCGRGGEGLIEGRVGPCVDAAERVSGTDWFTRFHQLIDADVGIDD